MNFKVNVKNVLRIVKHVILINVWTANKIFSLKMGNASLLVGPLNLLKIIFV